MEVRPVFFAALLLIACGSLGLLAVRLSNPLLKGLGWLSAAFGASSLAMVCIASVGHAPPIVSNLLGNLLLVVAFTLMNASVMELTEQPRRFSRIGAALLLFTLVKDVFLTYIEPNRLLRFELAGFIFAAQALECIFYLLRSRRQGGRMAVWYTVFVFGFFAAFNLFRTAVLAVRGNAPEAFATDWLQATAVLVFLATALGGCFGLFWISNSNLRFSFEQLASTDWLTGIDNRRMFELTCEKERARSLRSGEPFSLLLGDLDHFKLVNDRFGHMAGDTVLRATAACIRSALRTSDTLGRWGGEEFIVLLPCCPLADALEKAEAIRLSIASMSVPLPTGEVPVSMSFGVATFCGQGDELNDVIGRADEALYRAKASGRNRIFASDPQKDFDRPLGEQQTNIAL